MNNLTNNSKIIVSGEQFKIVDLRESGRLWQGEETYFATPRPKIIKAEYSKEDLIEDLQYKSGTILDDRDRVWIDGKKYVLVVKNIKASDAIMFLTEETYNLVKGK